MSGWITHADCKGLEPRVLADRTNCKVLLEIFRDPNRAEHIYEILGEQILGRKVIKYDASGAKTKDYDLAKEIILATNYNAAWRTLQARLANQGIEQSDENCKGFIQSYLGRLAPEVKDYIWSQRRLVVRDQQITCLTGFVNYLPNEGTEGEGFKHTWNQAVNVEIQHTASMIAILWMNLIQRMLRKEGLTHRDVHAVDTVLLGPVHDSVTHDVRTKWIATRMLEIYKEALTWAEGAPMVALIGRRLIVPLDVDVAMAADWEACK